MSLSLTAMCKKIGPRKKTDNKPLCTHCDFLLTNQIGCLLPPANIVCEGYVFTCVCLSTGGSTWAVTPWACTPPGQVHPTPPLGRSTPWGRYPLGRYTPGQVHPLGRYTSQGSYTPWAGTSRAGTAPCASTPPQAGTPPWAGTTPLGRYNPLGRYKPPGQVHHRHSACWDTVNKWAVRIPLECILV